MNTIHLHTHNHGRAHILTGSFISRPFNVFVRVYIKGDISQPLEKQIYVGADSHSGHTLFLSNRFSYAMQFGGQIPSGTSRTFSPQSRGNLVHF